MKWQAKKLISVMAAAAIWLTALSIVPVFAEPNLYTLETGFDTDFESAGNPFKVLAGNATIESIEGANGQVLHVDASSRISSVQYRETAKYSFDYYSEFRLKIAKNTGTIIVNLYRGDKRTQINIKSNETQVLIPFTKSNGSNTNSTVTIKNQIPDYTAGEWHTWKVIAQNGIQSIFCDNTLLFTDYLHTFSDYFTIAFYGTSGNDFYVDDFKYGEYSPEAATEDISGSEKAPLYQSDFDSAEG